MDTIFWLLVFAAICYYFYRRQQKKDEEVFGNSEKTLAAHKVLETPAPIIPRKKRKIFPAQDIVPYILKECDVFADDDPAEMSDDFSVAGITFHDFADSEDGVIFGYAQREPWNDHDPNAIAIYSWDGSQLGYIPRSQQDGFNDFTDLDTIPMTCLISHFINEDYEKKPTGTVTLYKGTESAINKTLTNLYNGFVKRHLFIL